MADVKSAVWPFVCTVAFDDVHAEFTLVDATVIPDEFSSAMFTAVDVAAMVHAAVIPVFLALSVL
jgi:hypothetical protein